MAGGLAGCGPAAADVLRHCDLAVYYKRSNWRRIVVKWKWNHSWTTIA